MAIGAMALRHAYFVLPAESFRETGSRCKPVVRLTHLGPSTTFCNIAGCTLRSCTTCSGVQRRSSITSAGSLRFLFAARAGESRMDPASTWTLLARDDHPIRPLPWLPFFPCSSVTLFSQSLSGPFAEPIAGGCGVPLEIPRRKGAL